MYNNNNTQYNSRNDTHNSYATGERQTYENAARREYGNNTNEQRPSVQPEEKVHKTIHHKYEELDLKLENPDLTDAQKQKFKELGGKLRDVFALSNMELEGTEILESEIHVKQDARPARQKAYNYSEKARAEKKKQVRKTISYKIHTKVYEYMVFKHTFNQEA